MNSCNSPEEQSMCKFVIMSLYSLEGHSPNLRTCSLSNSDKCVEELDDSIVTKGLFMLMSAFYFITEVWRGGCQKRLP
jgi:hypothetical protein